MFQAGFARVDVTPPLGTILTGYFEPRISDGILDPVELNALAISNEEDTILIITGDFMYTPERAMTRYRQLIAEETGVPMEHIFAQTIHQHTSTTPGPNGPTDSHYQHFLERKFCDVARMALADRSAAEVSVAQEETSEPISFIRRFRMKDGSTQTNPGYGNPDVEAPIGEADNTVRLVKFERKGAKDIALVNFATHPDVIGGNQFSADWPGFVRRFTEADIPNVNCILVNGAQGDTNHINIYAKGVNRGYEYSRHMGRVITDTVIGLWNRTKVIAPGKITGKVIMKRTPANMSGIERIEECLEITRALNEGTYDKPLTMGDRGEIRRIVGMEYATLIQKVPVSIAAFGSVALIGYGGEPFTEYADIPRKAVPELFVLSACLTNGAQGYLPSVSAFEEGGYESRTTNFTAAVAPALQNTAIELLREHAAKNGCE